MKNYFLFALALFGFCIQGFSQRIDIVGVDSLSVNTLEKKKKLFGNIHLVQDGSIHIMCDQAILNDINNTVDASGNVRIYQIDTFNLIGQTLFYDGNTKMARITGDVVLSDNSMTLYTPILDYNTSTKSGYYSGGGKIINGTTTLSSNNGWYSARDKVFYFKKNVVLVNPEYTMNSDTLIYNSITKTAFFQGPTTIVSAENKIICNAGWYNTLTEESRFHNQATIYSPNSSIAADSILYFRKTQSGKAYRNIVLIDSSEDIEVYGHYGEYNQNTGKTLVTNLPIAIRKLEQDSLLLMADTFYYFSDSANRHMRAYKNAFIYSGEMQGKCDSLVYGFSDSTIKMYHNPVLWTAVNQISGDSMSILIKNKKVEMLVVRQNSFIISKEPEGLYNQIAGKNMNHYFENNKLKTIVVDANAESIYYIKENDTGAYVGVNKVACSLIKIQLDSGKIQSIRFYQDVVGGFVPLKDFTEDESKLKGFNWYENKRPQKQQFIDRKNAKPEFVFVKQIEEKAIEKPKKRKILKNK